MMSGPLSNNPPPPAELVDYGVAPQPKKSRWKLWLLLGFGSVLFIVAVCAGGFAWFVLGGKSEVQPIAEAFLKLTERGDYAGAYASVGPEWTTLQKKEGFIELEKFFHDQLGPIRSKTVTGFDIKNENGTKIAVLGYDAYFKNAAGTITMTLTKSTGAWKVVGHRVDSPLFKKLLTCPHCKTVNQTFAKFCSSCGKPMRISKEK